MSVPASSIGALSGTAVVEASGAMAILVLGLVVLGLVALRNLSTPSRGLNGPDDVAPLSLRVCLDLLLNLSKKQCKMLSRLPASLVHVQDTRELVKVEPRDLGHGLGGIARSDSKELLFSPFTTAVARKMGDRPHTGSRGLHLRRAVDLVALLDREIVVIARIHDGDERFV